MKLKIRKNISLIIAPIMILYVIAPGLSYGGEYNTHEPEIALGGTARHPNPPGSSSALSILNNPFRYSSYYADYESGMNYCKARYFAPELMQFITRDTWEVPNRYDYCNNNPVGMSDPDGHDPSTIAGAIIGSLFTCSLIGLILYLRYSSTLHNPYAEGFSFIYSGKFAQSSFKFSGNLFDTLQQPGYLDFRIAHPNSFDQYKRDLSSINEILEGKRTPNSNEIAFTDLLADFKNNEWMFVFQHLDILGLSNQASFGDTRLDSIYKLFQQFKTEHLGLESTTSTGECSLRFWREGDHRHIILSQLKTETSKTNPTLSVTQHNLSHAILYDNNQFTGTVSVTVRKIRTNETRPNAG